MQFGTKAGNPAKTRCHCVVVGVFADNQLSDTAKLLDKASNGFIRKVLARGDTTGKAGQTIFLHDVPNVNAPRVLVVGLGNRDSLEPGKFVQLIKATFQALNKTTAKTVLCCLLEAEVTGKDLYWQARRIVEQFEDGAYTFVEMKGKPPTPKENLEQIDLQLADRDQQEQVAAGIKDATAVMTGIRLHKDVSNTPGNICTPAWMADKARQLAKQYSTLSTKVLEEADMTKLGMGAFMAVSQGSDQPGKMIIIEHAGGKPKDKPQVLVGKGISFDTGGISLKTNAGMADMIFDMCGAASVLGTMTTVAELNLPINVIGVVAAAENMPSGRATRPGDIVTSMSGQTIEILNTDAEGRLVLCDALTYIARYKPEAVIDIATLTGAAIVALGSPASALFANNDDLARELTEAGEETRDRVWRLPIWEDYQSSLNSALADMQNVGGREASSIVAACFLARYTKKYRWAHLDIAATAFKGGAAKGATGRPVTLLTQYLMDRAQDAA